MVGFFKQGESNMLNPRYLRIILCLAEVRCSLAVVTITHTINGRFGVNYLHKRVSRDVCTLIDKGLVKDFGDGTYLLTKAGKTQAIADNVSKPTATALSVKKKARPKKPTGT
jgi:hypothetical protein